MIVSISINFSYISINRAVSPEAKQSARQAWLGLEKIVGESLFSLFFSYIASAVAVELLNNLICFLAR